MALLELLDKTAERYESGRDWGAGPYEWLRAVADFGVDPTHVANQGICDLDRAPVDAAGLVRFDADLRLLRPADAARRNGKLLLVVPNRGHAGGVPFSVDAPFLFGESDVPHPGDGLLLEDGWTVAWCGWQWDVTGRPGMLGLTAPEVPIGASRMRIEFRPDADTPTRPLSDTSIMFTFAEYPTADRDDPDAVLYQRTAPDAAPEPLPRDSWRFVDDVTVELDGGFRAFHWYTLVYATSRNPVTGLGLLAVRDAAAALRAEYGLSQVYAFGVSQSGRFLRQFLAEGRNLDEQGRRVFDGVFAHIAGGRQGEFNHRHAQPSLTHVIGFGNRPPYDSAGLLARQRALGGVPKLMLTNTSWEYWRGDGALVHVDPDSGADVPDDPDTRVYLLRGTDHMGAMPFKDVLPAANPVHQIDVQPLLRALFFRLDEWATGSSEPPPSDVPRQADGTATTREAVLERFAAAGVHRPDPAVLNVTRDVDLGGEADRGIGRWPLQLGAAKVAVVADVDAGGNERAGLALPAVAAPVAAYTGWNPRRPVEGLPDVLYEFLGSRLPLLAGERPERKAYERDVQAAAAELVSRRVLLERDVERTVAEALRLYDSGAPDS